MTLREQYIQNNPAGLEWDKWLESRLSEAYESIEQNWEGGDSSENGTHCIFCSEDAVMKNGVACHPEPSDCIALKARVT